MPQIIELYDYESTYGHVLDDRYRESFAESMEELRCPGKLRYQIKTVKSGTLLESEIYPVWLRYQLPKRAKKQAPSREAQKNLNDKNTKKQIMRYMEANFSRGDIILHGTFPDKYLPDEKTVLTYLKNYFARVRRYRKKRGMPELKYLYVVEYNDPENPYTDKKIRLHVHIAMSRMNRDDAEELWQGGQATNADRLKPNDFGLEGMSSYLTKRERGGRRWGHSTNLDKPKVTVSNTRLRKRQAERMALQENSLREAFEKMYPKYRYEDVEIRYSEYVSGWYIYAKMRKKPPKEQQAKSSKGRDETV